MLPSALWRRPASDRIKRFLVNLLCLFVPSKKYRELIRHYFMTPRICLGRPLLPIKKRSQPINIAFCFNGHLARQFGVTIASLLANSKNRAKYNIYCVVDDSVTPEMRNMLTSMVKTWDQDSSLIFLEANHDFDRCPTRHATAAPYYRLMLPVLLPELDEVIYADVDMIFCRDLIELAEFDLGDHLLAGVQERSDGYINSGLMVMNLAGLRREGIYETWPEIRCQKDFPNELHDQDLLNITCRGRILYLPVKYNFWPTLYYLFYKRGGITPQDQHELKYNVVIVHYNTSKPWREKKRCFMSWLWWEYARLTPFYEDLLAELKSGSSA